MRRCGSVLGVLLASVTGAAQAQVYSQEQTRESHDLPAGDFIWRWGVAAEDPGRDSPDFEGPGAERDFRCVLRGRFLAGSKGAHERFSPSYVRELGTSMRLSMFFIWDASVTMNSLRSHLDWATLDCVRPGRLRAQQQSNAVQQVQRELERRRARAPDDE
jgi:hypothetical protein